MGAVPRREQLDERFARHLRENRLAQVQIGEFDAIGIRASLVQTTIPVGAFPDIAIGGAEFDTGGFLVGGVIVFPVTAMYYVNVTARWQPGAGWRTIACGIANGGPGGDPAPGIGSDTADLADSVEPLVHSCGGLVAPIAGDRLAIGAGHGAAATRDLYTGGSHVDVFWLGKAPSIFRGGAQ